MVTLTDHRSCSATVTVDNYQASFDMAIFLTHMGHRRIGYLRGPANLSTSEKRERGFLDAMQAAGIPQRSISVVDGGFSVDIGMQAMQELMSLPRPPTAVFYRQRPECHRLSYHCVEYRVESPGGCQHRRHG